MKFDYSPVAYAGQFWIQGRLVSGDNGFAGDVLSRELLLASMTAFMSKAFGAIVVMPIPPMPYIITMLEAGAIILNTFWAVTPLAQLLTETMSQSTPSSLLRPSSGITFAFRILTAVSG